VTWTHRGGRRRAGPRGGAAVRAEVDEGAVVHDDGCGCGSSHGRGGDAAEGGGATATGDGRMGAAAAASRGWRPPWTEAVRHGRARRQEENLR
jgi:hypothetical protein